MVGALGILAGGAGISIVIRAVDQFTNVFKKVNASMLAMGVAFTAVGIAGAKLTSGLIRIAGEFEQTNIAFTTMLGSAEDADKLLRELADFAARTPFTITGVEQNAKQLLAMSIEVDKLLPTLKTLGDVSAGLNVPLNRIALNFGQVKVQGRLTGRELRDFSVAGVPLIAELAKNLSKSQQEIKEMVSAGKIGFPEVEAAFISMSSEGGKFFDLMDAQSKTFLGQISNIQDSLIRIARVMGQVFLPAAKLVAQKLQVMIGFFEQHPTLTKFAAVMLGLAVAAALIIGPILIMVAMLPVLIAGFGALSAVTLPLTLTILGIAAAFIALIALAVLLWTRWETLGTKTKILLRTFVPFIAIPITIIKNWSMLKGAMKDTWNFMVKAAEIGVNTIIGFLNTLINAFNNLPGVLRGFSTVGNVPGVSFSGGLFDTTEVAKVVEEQKNVTKELTNQEILLQKLKGFKLITRTGDILRPTGALKGSEFQSELAFNLAVRERAGRAQVPGQVVEINIENIMGLDPDEIAQALQASLSNKISLG